MLIFLVVELAFVFVGVLSILFEFSYIKGVDGVGYVCEQLLTECSCLKGS